MIGMVLSHRSGVSGVVEAVAAHPDATVLIRISDHWFFAAECEAV
jgi:hypothetical protein